MATTGDSDPHAAVAHADEAHADGHSADHGGAPLGPIDWGAWLVSVVGVGAGLIVALALFVSIQNG